MRTRLSILLIIFVIFSSCSKKKEPPPHIFPIQKAKSEIKDAPLFIETIGHVDPIYTIDIRSRVEGELMQVYFKEGEEVEKDSPLFLIDPRPYEIALEKAEATLKQNLTELHLAEDKLERYTPLLKDEYISQLDFDTLITDVERYRAIIQENKAQINDAKLNIEYCHIAAPIQGKTGIIQVDRGNLIAPNAEKPLMTLNQITPIYVLFSIPEKELYQIQKRARVKPLEVQASFDKFEEKYYVGELHLIDNEVDVKVGMVKMRAIFPNQDKELWPGKFVRVRVILEIIKDAVLIPYQSVLITVNGPVVFVVKDDNTVDMRPVELGQRQNGDIVINKGVKANEYIVTEGQINLTNGSRVFVPKEEQEAEK